MFNDLSTLLLSPFTYTFMLQAFLVVFVLSLPMAILSCYIVLKGWALMGDAIAHAVLPGVVIAYILSIPLSIGAFFAGLICALTTGYLKENTRLKEDTIMGIVFSTMFAIGIILFHKTDTDLHLTHLLLGDVLGIETANIIEAVVISLAILSVLCLQSKNLTLLIFDPQHAQVIGLAVRFWHYMIQVLLALSIVAALQAVGMILSIALLIIPGACALVISKRFNTMLYIAASIALSCSFLGVYISFFLDSSPAATIVLLMTAIFCMLFCYKNYLNYKAVKQVTSENKALSHNVDQPMQNV